MHPEFDRARLQIENEIALKLNKIGLFFRIFSRSKSKQSFEKKVSAGNRRDDGRKIQDIIGIRVVCYFRKDEEIVEKILKKMYVLDNESVTCHSAETFCPRCNNFVLKINDSNRIINLNDSLIDQTFEVQVRTVFSEGWHEVEHDMRYKHKELWTDVNANRELNSVYATLEMCDWGIERIMSEMAYSGYKNANFIKMITGKFMLRLSSSAITEELAAVIEDIEIRKKIFKSNRGALIDLLLELPSTFPITANLIIYLCNYLSIHNDTITSLTPPSLFEYFENK